MINYTIHKITDDQVEVKVAITLINIELRVVQVTPLKVEKIPLYACSMPDLCRLLSQILPDRRYARQTPSSKVIQYGVL